MDWVKLAMHVIEDEAFFGKAQAQAHSRKEQEPVIAKPISVEKWIENPQSRSGFWWRDGQREKAAYVTHVGQSERAVITPEHVYAANRQQIPKT